MYKTSLAAALLALCAAMPFTASAQTKTELRIFCATAVDDGGIIPDLPSIRNEKLGGNIGYAECLNALATLLQERRDFYLLIQTSGWMESENIRNMVSHQICLNRILNRWPSGTCDEFLESYGL